MSERETQCDILRAHFDRGGSLTVLEAIYPPFRCYALSQRCGELRQIGYPVVGVMVKLDNGKRVKRYSLEREVAQ